MKRVVSLVNKLKRQIGERVEERIGEFERVNDRFNELCFCILTANFNAERAIEIQQQIGEGFRTYSEKKLSAELKRLGYRYPNVRAKYIVEARMFDLEEALKKDDPRPEIVKGVKGLGWKEASHFLRNIGYKDYAIIDFHIVDFLVEYDLVNKPNSMSQKCYLEIEEVLGEIAKKSKIDQARLDLYLWYYETGKILK
jgi:N-glycosylase/DNA lyase